MPHTVPARWLLLTLVLLSACDARMPAASSAPPRPSTTEPGATRSPAATASAPAPSIPRSLAGLIASPVDPVVELRVSIRGDVEGPGRTPELTLYRDGTIIRRVDGGPRVTKVTFEGRDLLVRTASKSGLFGESGGIPVDPDYAGGFTSYVIDLRTYAEPIRRSTPNAVAEKDAAAAQRLITLAERLVEPESILPSDAWLIPASAAVPFVAARYRLETIVQPSAADPNDPNLPRDIETVNWPLADPLPEWGLRYDVALWDAETIYRCGTLSLAEAVRVEAAFAESWSSERLPGSDWMGAQLTWRAQKSAVDVWMSSLLPEEDACDGTPA